MQHIKVKTLQGINWDNYSSYCKKNGLSKNNFKNLKMWIEGVLNL